MENTVCCICGKSMGGYGNNAQPLYNGRCCDDCNNSYVMPSRFMSYLISKDSKKKSSS